MKLNVKRTTLVGLAFMAICAFWQMYDFTVPLVLKNTFHLGDTWAGVVMAMDNVLALFLLPLFGTLSDRCHTSIGRRMPFILFGTFAAAMLLCCLPMVIAAGSLTLFLVCLGALLLAMAVYRSPAVALMPDVTPKPLRSKGNAIINLMGAVGGMIALGLIRVAVVHRLNPATGETVSDYAYLYWIIAAVMMASVVVLALTIREPKLVAEMEAINYGETAEELKKNEVREKGTGRLNKDVFKSLMMLLCSISLWFMGYNAVTTAFSKYAITVWGTAEGDAAFCVMMATVAAILSYWPVGILSSRVGRKRMIQTGILILTGCFLATGFFQGMSPFLYVIFALLGFGWASINVNSFPMVVEMASGADTGKYTGYYYTFSMAAQVLTPILSGALMEHVGYHTLFPYAAVMVLGSFITMLFVRHGDSKPEAKRGLEALDVDEE